MKKAKEMQYAVLGLGIFGSTVAKTLSEYGCDVIAMDQDIDCVNRLSTVVSQVVQGDMTNKESLKEAGIEDCDVAIVATSSHLEDTIMSVFALKELGVPYVVVKVKNKLHMEILSKIGADKIVRPEKEMGERVAKGLLSRNIVEMVDFDSDYSIVEILAPKNWIGNTLRNLNARANYGINVLGIRKNNDSKLSISPSADYKICGDDHLVVIAETAVFENSNFLNDCEKENIAIR